MATPLSNQRLSYSPTATVQDALAPPTKSPAPKATTESEPQRHVLPKNLPNAIKHLSDGELDFLHATTLEELKRRGRIPQGVETDLQTLRHRFVVRAELPKRSPPTKKRRHVGMLKSF